MSVKLPHEVAFTQGEEVSFALLKEKIEQLAENVERLAKGTAKAKK